MTVTFYCVYGHPNDGVYKEHVFHHVTQITKIGGHTFEIQQNVLGMLPQKTRIVDVYKFYAST